MARKTYYVYVIELDKALLKNKKFMSRSPQYKAGKPCVYVGQSAKSPKERFNQHLDGYRANRYVRKYGKNLIPILYEEYNPLPTREDAEEMEEYLADKLRKKGYAVWSN